MKNDWGSLRPLLAVAFLAIACEPTGTGNPGVPPPGGSLDSPLCGTGGGEILMLFDTSARMGESSGTSVGGRSLSRQELVADAIKRTLPHLKKTADFGLLTFPSGSRGNGNGNGGAPAPGACAPGDVQVAPSEPYGWIVSQVESFRSGGTASAAAALDRARSWFGGHPADGQARAVVLFTAGGDECGGDLVAAVEALALAGVPTWVLSFDNAEDAALLDLAAERGGRARSADPVSRYHRLSADTGVDAVEQALREAYRELCDGLDNDCDGRTDEDFDADGDGWATCNQDCDDTDASAYPGASEGGRAAPYAPARVTGWYQGTTRGGAPVDPEASGVAEALDHDLLPGRGAAFSLGFDGYVEVEFDCPLRNGPGADLRVFERTAESDGGRAESAVAYGWDVDAKAWVLLGTASGGGGAGTLDVATDLDLGPLPRLSRLRVVNATPTGGMPAGADGFDVNGILALHDCGDCDGRDNDCDGDADEGYGVGGTCIVGLGACRATGEQACSADGLSARCVAPAAPGGAESCNGQDDDCDGLVDEGLAQACTAACGTGQRLCVDGVTGPCVVDRPAAELCNGLDDDCDGAVDEGFGVGTPCTVGAAGCATGGTKACSPDGLESLCMAGGPVPDGGDERCNGIDDDCDGDADEGKGLCPDGQVCYRGQCVYD